MNDTHEILKTKLNEVLIMLHKIRRTYASERLKTIGELQNKIWDAPEFQTEELYFLQDLAADVNFYEPIEKDRDETLGYFGESKLLELMGAAQEKIGKLLQV